ncbi:MAG: transcription antitermination protein NusB, partial [Chitinophagaceae bacterium]
MISRRNIRVKVMQTLYTIETLDDLLKPGEPQKILQQHFSETRSILVYLTWFLTEVARYAETQAHKRASKHLPTAEDLSVNTKIAGNEVLWKMLEDPALKEQFEKEKPQLIFRQTQGDSTELIRKIYLELVETPAYKTYTATQSRDKQEEKKIMEFILNDMLLANEVFISHIEENFSGWNDDGEMIVQLLAGYIQKPGSINFKELLSPDKAQFAKNLLQTVLDKTEHLQSIITPKLKNWDPERIAILDMLLMKMGLAEFLYFETIPPKVTI